MPLILSSQALSFNIEGLGYGAVFKTTKSRVDAKFTKFLQKDERTDQVRLSISCILERHKRLANIRTTNDSRAKSCV